MIAHINYPKFSQVLANEVKMREHLGRRKRDIKRDSNRKKGNETAQMYNLYVIECSEFP